ncbi:MAG TPA: hypothetical protein VEH07_06940 [Alphaproteobacteria bacterium]|nr:hypothetical protein [Alphaproteobacteria bacterium]
MQAKSYATVAAAIFLLMAIVQAARAAMGLSLIVAGYSIPIYASVVVAVVTGVLALVGFMASR